jgi:hypothetical protein
MSNSRLLPIDQANLLAGHAVTAATAFLDGRHTPEQLDSNSSAIWKQLIAFTDTSLEVNIILEPVRILAFTMASTARHAMARPDVADSMKSAVAHIRFERWQHAMASVVELVMHESRQLKKD